MSSDGLTHDDTPNKLKELSGRVAIMVCECPECHKVHSAIMPVEHAESQTAWRINGRIALLCKSCNKK